MSGVELMLTLKYFASNISETILECTDAAKISINSLHIVDERYDTFPFPGLPYLLICSARNGSKFDINSRQPI